MDCEGLTVCQRRTGGRAWLEEEKKILLSCDWLCVVPLTNRIPGPLVIVNFGKWVAAPEEGTGGQAARGGRTGSKGAWSARRTHCQDSSVGTLLRSVCCTRGVGRSGCCCAVFGPCECVFACECFFSFFLFFFSFLFSLLLGVCVLCAWTGKIKDQAGQREPARNAGRTERQPTSARLAIVRHTARDGRVHTGDPFAAAANMSPALRWRPR